MTLPNWNEPDPDPVIQEIREIRAEMVRETGGDIRKLVKMLKESENKRTQGLAPSKAARTLTTKSAKRHRK